MCGGRDQPVSEQKLLQIYPEYHVADYCEKIVFYKYALKGKHIQLSESFYECFLYISYNDVDVEGY